MLFTINSTLKGIIDVKNIFIITGKEVYKRGTAIVPWYLSRVLGFDAVFFSNGGNGTYSTCIHAQIRKMNQHHFNTTPAALSIASTFSSLAELSISVVEPIKYPGLAVSIAFMLTSYTSSGVPYESS